MVGSHQACNARLGALRSTPRVGEEDALSRRCSYCLQRKPLSAFRTVEHVMPAALGGGWRTRDVCDSCQTRANEAADRLITQDFLVLFLRSAYGIEDRNGDLPLAPRFT